MLNLKIGIMLSILLIVYLFRAREISIVWCLRVELYSVNSQSLVRTSLFLMLLLLDDFLS